MKKIIFYILLLFTFTVSAQEEPLKFKIFSPTLVPQNQNVQISVAGRLNKEIDTLFFTVQPNERIKLNSIIFRKKNFSKKFHFKKTFNKENSFYEYKFQFIPSLLDGKENEAYQIILTFNKIRKDIKFNYYLTVVRTDSTVEEYSSEMSENSEYFLPPSYLRTYRVQDASGKALSLSGNSKFSFNIDNNEFTKNMLIEFWGKFSAPVNSFFNLIDSSTQDTLLSLSNNPLQLISASGKEAASFFGDCFMPNGTWQHFSILLSKDFHKADLYVNDTKIYSFDNMDFLNSEKMNLAFRTSGSNKSNFQIDVLNVWELNGSLISSFENKHYNHYLADSSKILASFNFDDKFSNNEENNRLGIILSGAKLVKSSAPIFSPVPDLNVNVANNLNSLEWKGKEFSLAKTYVLEKSFKGNKFSEIYKVDSDEDPNKVYYYSDFPDESSKVVYYRVKQINKDGSVGFSPTVKVGKAEQEEFILDQNYPNPFNPTTKISVEVLVQGEFQVIVYDLVGNTVQQLYSGFLTQGIHTFTFDGSNLPSGIYFYEIKSPHYNLVHKMILAK
ncbi:hypothetical protein BMS3Abin04_02139 [bacterium BMS3Abin04]|nr:hypothetical protein BMS3Abin04_02139 [bacterium BMS3Abin04]